MKPLFKNVLLRVEIPKEKEDDIDSLFKTIPLNPKLTTEATLIAVANDCDDEVQLAFEKKVVWNRKWLEIVEETEEYQIVLTHETSLVAIA